MPVSNDDGGRDPERAPPPNDYLGRGIENKLNAIFERIKGRVLETILGMEKTKKRQEETVDDGGGRPNEVQPTSQGGYAGLEMG